jgi:hypothetical protein
MSAVAITAAKAGMGPATKATGVTPLSRLNAPQVRSSQSPGESSRSSAMLIDGKGVAGLVAIRINTHAPPGIATINATIAVCRTRR